jgi:phosphate transport system substrate-binding protein
MFKKLFNNEAGVSPIVATLVLVVVAIAGAAAVGTIMGSFSSDVSDSASSEAAGQSASTELLLAGSTTVQPVSEELAERFMKEYPGIKVSVSGGGSGAGIASTELGVIDIGGASEEVDTTTDHPDLQVYKIGGSGVVVITNGVAPLDNVTSVSSAELQAIYEGCTAGVITNPTIGGTALTGDVNVYKRLGSSGTQHTLVGYVLGSTDLKKEWDDAANCDAMTADGNAAMASEVLADTTAAIGFCDVGFVTTQTMLDIDGYTASADNIKDTLKGGSTYPEGLLRPLNYMTLGAPSAIEKQFLDFAMNYDNNDIFEDAGYYSIVELNS